MTGCAAQHAGAKRQPATDFAAVDPLMDEGESEQARLFRYFIDRSDHEFPKAWISTKLNFAPGVFCDG